MLHKRETPWTPVFAMCRFNQNLRLYKYVLDVRCQVLLTFFWVRAKIVQYLTITWETVPNFQLILLKCVKIYAILILSSLEIVVRVYNLIKKETQIINQSNLLGQVLNEWTITNIINLFSKHDKSFKYCRNCTIITRLYSSSVK